MPPSDQYDVNNVAIIGAGPAGLAAAKYLIAEEAFKKIDIFEQRDTVGGVWNYTAEPGPGLPSSITSDPAAIFQTPSHGGDGAARNPAYVSPMYDQLETNLPRSLMQYSDLEFPSESQLFPQREVVMHYLQDYSVEVRNLIQFETHVEDVSLVPGANHDRWTVRTKQSASGNSTEGIYDAVIVASGHFEEPHIPPIPGLMSWIAAYPNSVIHSKAYRNPERFREKRVIVVGNSASGIDIGTQISQVCKHPLTVSRRSVSFMSSGNADPLKEELPEITEFIIRDRAIRFADGNIRSNIDAIVFCTGYSYSYPFLSTLKPQVTSNGLRAEHVYQHIFYIPHPTLAFLALPQRVVPFIISEAQSAAAARVWANRIQLPSLEGMVRWEHELIAELGPGKTFHAMNFPKDVDYINELYDWSMTARPSGMGKDPPRWGGKERWVRERCAEMRAAFVALGITRHRIHTLKDLGFDPEEALIPRIESRSVL